jgi:uncharacterized alkaline shock family protein YloU
VAVAEPGAAVETEGPVVPATRAAVEATAPALADPADRGGLEVADRVVQRIVLAATREVDGTAVVTTGITTPMSRSYPRATVVVAGDRVRARVEVAGRWPVPAARLAADVRATVARQLVALAGLRVDAVDVTVAAMVRHGGPGRRELR